MSRKITVLLLLFLIASVPAQHRGDNLAFQGLPLDQFAGVKALALGGAFTAQSGDAGALYFNPAGLAGIDKPQLSLSAGSSTASWRENQVYRPNRMFWTLAFYLEGLYIPDPADNGVWDYELAQDSSYQVAEPVLGLEPFSEEAADWQREVNPSGLQQISAAVPLRIGGEKLVLSAGYASNSLNDFDRNDTFLDPHIGYDEYGVVERVVNDTVRFSWARFVRQREGDLHTFNAGLAWELSSRIQIGAAATLLDGASDDLQSLRRVGYFDIAKDNRFRFSYDTLDVVSQGHSDYRTLHFNLGAVLKLERLSLGFHVKMPYTITREWSASTVTANASGAQTAAQTGTAEFKHPASVTFGAMIQPVDPFRFMLDYQFTPYSRGEIDLQSEDPTNRTLPDQSDLRCGLAFAPVAFLELMAGYRQTTALFVPDGAAIKDRGPAANAWSLGAGITLGRFGRLDLAWVSQRLTYYDSYYSNTNYATQNLTNFVAGYTYQF
jgi:long-subunit fatty acid transport protein